MLTINRNPDFVQFTVEGVYCVNCAEFSPGVQEFCVGSPTPDSIDAVLDPSREQGVVTTSGCGSSALAYVDAGSWLGALKPSPADVCGVEHDMASGMIAWTKLTPAQLAEKAALDKVTLERERVLAGQLRAKEDRKAAAREVLRLKAKDDPFAAAMADLFDVDLES